MPEVTGVGPDGAAGNRPDRALRQVSLAALAAGAAGSEALMLYAGRGNDLILLKVMFTGWVLSPFAALGWAHAASNRWRPLVRATLHSVTIGVAVASLAIYAARALWPPRTTGAFLFVACPPVSWLVIAAALAAATLLSRRRAR